MSFEGIRLGNCPVIQSSSPDGYDLFTVSADYLIGRDVPKPRGGGPTGKLRQVFDNASKLSRRQQQRIIEVVEDILVARGVHADTNGS